MKESQIFHHEVFSNLDNFQNDFRNRNLNALILREVRGRTYLDIGCGSGYLLNEAGKKGIASTGIEPNQKLRQLSAKLHGKLDIRNLTIEKLPSINKKFDTISLIDVLEHIKDDKAALRMIHGRLNAGGRLVLVVPSFQFLYGKRDKKGGHYRRYSKAELLGKVRAAGFKVEKCRYWNMLAFFPYLISEKLLMRELESDLRTAKKKSLHERTMINALHAWFKHVENNMSFGFGISLICVAKKK